MFEKRAKPARCARAQLSSDRKNTRVPITSLKIIYKVTACFSTQSMQDCGKYAFPVDFDVAFKYFISPENPVYEASTLRLRTLPTLRLRTLIWRFKVKVEFAWVPLEQR